jgi:putative sterol carrier protein
MSALRVALTRFIERYHGATDLVAEQAGWNCRIRLVAADTQETVPVAIADGRVQAIDAWLDDVTLIVTADEAVLLDVLELRRDPNEPYLFGELTIEGPEPDFMRLDYVMTIMAAAHSR